MGQREHVPRYVWGIESVYLAVYVAKRACT